MRGIEIPEGVEVPEIEADDLEVMEAEPVTATAIQRHRGASVAQHAGDLFGVVASYAERGITFPIESLERLIALQERAQERNARGAFITALAAFQSECPPIRKSETAKITTRKGGQYSYTFAPLDEIARTIRPLLHRHGLSYSWDSTVEGDRVAVVCTLRHIDGHAETAQFVCPTDTEASMSGAQKFAAALTFGRRQSLVQVLGLTSADGDEDGALRPVPESGEKITAAQAADLLAKMGEVGADRARFLRWAQVTAIEEIPANRLADCVAALEQKRRAS